MLISLKTVKKFFRIFLQRFNETNCTDRAAALTFTSLLSLVPLMTVSFAIMTAFPEFQTLGNHLQNFIFNNFVATSGDVIQNYLQNFVAHATKLSEVGLLFLMVTAIMMMYTLEKSLNAIWNVNKARNWISALILYWTILTLSPVLIGAGFAISTHLASFSETITDISKPFLSCAPFVLSAIAFNLLYVSVPNCHVPVHYGFFGAIVAAILFELAKYGFAFYVTHFPTYQLLYGALAAIPIFLIWVYLCWLITLVGGLVSNVLQILEI